MIPKYSKISMTILKLFLFANLIQLLVKYSFQITFLVIQIQFESQKKLKHEVQTHNFFWKSQIFNIHILIQKFHVHIMEYLLLDLNGMLFEEVVINTTLIVNMTFQNALSNSKNGFVSLTGFQYSGGIDFLLKISEFTSSSVSVEINKVDFKFQNQINLVFKLSQLKMISLIYDYKLLLSNILISQSIYNLNRGLFLTFKVQIFYIEFYSQCDLLHSQANIYSHQRKQEFGFILNKKSKK
ncbi:unnamed protein product [Paramecium pentaurelia]|uniref:Uncharacterized protein n=1 Tax=Paramecium pentaurelia TaxID=43138 RepID=A0A8S1YKC0_9CILI|nr:unnamed protein product [Paramecium pentaurelia]